MRTGVCDKKIVAVFAALCAVVVGCSDSGATKPSRSSDTASAGSSSSFVVARSAPAHVDAGLLRVVASPASPMQVIDFTRLYSGDREGDVVIWLQNVSHRTVAYVEYRLRVPDSCNGAASQRSVATAAGHPTTSLVSPDITFMAPSAAPGERLVMVISRDRFRAIEQGIREAGCDTAAIRPELVFDSVHFIDGETTPSAQRRSQEAPN